MANAPLSADRRSLPAALRKAGVSALLLAGLVIGLVFSEWLFLATGQSFFNSLTGFESLGLVVETAAAVALPVFVLSFSLALLGSVSGWQAGETLSLVLIAAVGGLILSCAGLLLVDNFTYTVFSAGLVTARTAWLRAAYLVAFLAVWVLSARSTFGWLEAARSRTTRPACAVAGLFVLAILAVGVSRLGYAALAGGHDRAVLHAGASGIDHPNILIFSSDGVDATHLSMHGYHRQTSPFLDTLVAQSPISENSFSNNASTPGAVISLLTGKLATTTRVVYAPDVLKGVDAYQHLPGLLRRLGYRTLDMNLRHYADATDRNLRAGFDEGNFRAVESGRPVLPAVLEGLSSGPQALYWYFL